MNVRLIKLEYVLYRTPIVHVTTPRETLPSALTALSRTSYLPPDCTMGLTPHSTEDQSI